MQYQGVRNVIRMSESERQRKGRTDGRELPEPEQGDDRGQPKDTHYSAIVIRYSDTRLWTSYSVIRLVKYLFIHMFGSKHNPHDTYIPTYLQNYTISYPLSSSFTIYTTFPRLFNQW